ncbi:Hypothetical predicted protein [Paramuricea clavata]|uniref:Uncharacterized protein n=1 Tax=Paramuricea clavata TaxID=317549 RepID=A0A6S7INF7_PARCT|nr:Hypothetical predicted protein [Paramuricea clavata]
MVRCPVENETHSCYDLNISLDHNVIYSGSVIDHDALPCDSYFNFTWHTMAPLYPSLRSRKIFCRRKRKLRRSKSRIQYYPNSTASFQLLLCAGDIELNPGPDSDSTRAHQKHRNKRSNGTNSNISSICRDLPSGLKIVHWNLNSIAPHQGNTKLDELKLLLSNPGNENAISWVLRRPVVYKYLPTSNLDPDLEQLNDFVSSKITDDILLTIPPLTCDEFLQSLNQLDPHKATGLNGLSSKILKMSASVIAEPLTLILNQSITYGYFPMRWKTARVAPVHKSGSRTEKSNYRSISILCILSYLEDLGCETVVLMMDPDTGTVRQYGSENGIMFLAENEKIPLTFLAYFDNNEDSSSRNYTRKDVQNMFNKKYSEACGKPGSKVPYQNGGFVVSGLPDNILFKKPNCYGMDQIKIIMEHEANIVF